MATKTLRKSDFAPFDVKRYCHINSEGELSVKALDAKKWRDPPDGILFPEEEELKNRARIFRHQLRTAEFRIYAGISPEDNGPWMTLENEFRWLKTDGNAKRIVTEYAEKYGGQLDQLFNHPEEHKVDTFCVVIQIYDHTLGDAKSLKARMLAELKASEELRSYLVHVM